MAGVVVHANEAAQVSAAVQGSSGAAVLHFWAEWCGPAKQMSAIFAELARGNPTATFVQVRHPRRTPRLKTWRGGSWMLTRGGGQIDAEKVPEVAERFEVNAV